MAKSNIVARTGNEAMAEAMRQINPDVVAAYPITPATEVVQIFASYVADGLVDTEFVPVESEHSAMSACIGASAAGGRTMTGTSSQGLALMAEMLYIASGLRLPIVLADVNRALSSPINIHCDHSDTMMVRDAGWIQIFSENPQEAYDNMIQAMRIAETAALPTMVTTDGFIISHGMERVEIFDDKDVKDFVGKKKLGRYLLNMEKPITLGALDLQVYYFEHRRQLAEAMIGSKAIILDVAKAFKDKFGRSYGLFESYKLDDADCVIVIKKLIKQHQDSIEQFTKGSRLDLVDKETKELEILKSYLPQELGPDELKKFIEEAILSTAAASMKDMGKVMKEVMAKTAGACDNKLASDLIRQRLTS
jgi:pyruvate ferredoxin oxidoreductase alpha subunit